MASIRLGDLLIKAKVISESQLKAALVEQQKWGGKLGELLVRMNFVTEDMLVRALSKQMGVPSVNLESVPGVPPHVRAKIPAEVARDLVALPLQLRDEGKTLVVAMAEPQNLKQIDLLRSVTRCRIVTQLAGRQAIARSFGRFYQGEAEMEEADANFKLVNSQGGTLIKEIGGQERVPPPPPPQPAMKISPPAPVPVAPRASTLAEQPAAQAKSPGDMLRTIEETQRKEVTALKGIVELLIDKGIFTREEYLAKVKR